ncbi:hypothetical protein SAMN04490194_2153 [Pseudomonas migulae]|jgi:hypothetical protein|uniref:Uncharacterized protein n=1 Tax=Pseudomonas migulae TaxID=78543 RepID=A0A1H5INZ7_9PSED|nr:hypothetical protein SAMN04490194_2153 [Pseudomonas migulae]
MRQIAGISIEKVIQMRIALNRPMERARLLLKSYF